MEAWIDGILDSPDPAVAFRAHRLWKGEPDDDPAQRARRLQVASSDNVRRMLALRHPDGTIRHGNESGAYRKWQGPHGTLACLAELGYPAFPQAMLVGRVVFMVVSYLLILHLQRAGHSEASAP
jgi:hypothetical protein